MKNTTKSNNIYIGVVEDRNDPEQMGRIKVRFAGIHSELKSDVPTSVLPWAQVIQDITSAGVSGIGRSPTGIVEGTWVIGMFLDPGYNQKPIVLGTIAGHPTNYPNPDLGFNDPNGKYPSNIDQSDIPILSRDDAESSNMLSTKRETKLEDVPTAIAPHVFSVMPDKNDRSLYNRSSWSEPNPRYGGEERDKYPDDVNESTYPFNHVNTTEGGHTFEIDDTPNAERIHEYHTAGTFREIQPDGNRVTKINGKDYEIVVDNKNCYIRGSLNVTVAGNARLYVQGDMITEVDKDYYLTVKGDMITKVQGNKVTEIVSDSSTQINGNNSIRVTENHTETINKNSTLSVGINSKTTIGGNSNISVTGNHFHMNTGDYSVVVVNNINVGAANTIGFAADNTMAIYSTNSMTIETDSTMDVSSVDNMTTTSGNNMNITATADLTEVANNIHMNP